MTAIHFFVLPVLYPFNKWNPPSFILDEETILSSKLPTHCFLPFNSLSLFELLPHLWSLMPYSSLPFINDILCKYQNSIHVTNSCQLNKMNVTLFSLFFIKIFKKLTKNESYLLIIAFVLNWRLHHITSQVVSKILSEMKSNCFLKINYTELRFPFFINLAHTQNWRMGMFSLNKQICKLN
jgi:hypothetical protein